MNQSKFYLKIGGAVFGMLVAFMTIMSSFFTTDAGYTYVFQNTLTGGLTVYTEPGIHAKMPFFSRVTQYKQVATIAASNEASPEEYTRTIPPITATFADTYTGAIPATYRFRLPTGEEEVLSLHREFRSFDNLINSLLVPNAINVTVVTGTQYTGEEFFQGGLNRFKVQLEDQLRNGLYQTERRQVQVESTDLAPVSSENSSSGRLETRKQLVMKNVVLEDSNGNALRQENPLAQYGIEVTQVTIGRPLPEERLDRLLVQKKDLVAKRITAVQQIETAEAEAKAAQQQMEIEKRKAIQVAQKDKELAIIAEQKKVEMERQQAQLELVRKDKELQMAKADRDIQQAAAEAAEFEATKIKEVGLANVAVSQAELAAKQNAKDIYVMELQVKLAEVMYPNLKDVQITMPYYVAGVGQNGSIPNSLDAFMNLGLMDQLRKQSAPVGSFK